MDKHIKRVVHATEVVQLLERSLLAAQAMRNVAIAEAFEAGVVDRQLTEALELARGPTRKRRAVPTDGGHG